MQRTAEIRDVARVLLEAGYRSAYTRSRIRALLPRPADGLVDELGFVAEKDGRRLYLRNRIDFGWLYSQLELLPPLKVDEKANVIYADWMEICGGKEAPPSGRMGGRAWWRFWG